MVRRTRLILIVTALLIGAVGAAGVTLGPYLFERNDYAQVASIEQRTDFREPATLAAAWQLPVAATYRRSAYEFQSNPSFCGPASAANVLRSLGTDLSQQQVIANTQYDPWFGVLLGGLTLEQLADVLRTRTNGAVTVIRPKDLAEFRAQLARTNDLDRRYVVNFHRGPLFGRGHGHFSPLLGYLAAQDLVFVGDVNRDYQPFLVSSARLWSAVDTIDSSSGKKRGLLMVTVPPSSTSAR
jgi:hypothetical protein